MFKLIGAFILFYLAAMVIVAVIGVLLVVAVVWGAVKLAGVGWREWEGRDSQQVKHARERLLGPGEIDVRGF